MSDVDIVLEIATKGVEEVYKLSNAMTQLNRAVNGVSNPMKNLDARSRALSQAVGSADSSLKSHAKTLGQLARNNSILTNEMGRVRKEIAGLGKEFTVASGHSAAFSRAGIKDLQNYQKALKGVRIGALVEDLRSVSQEQKRLGKDAQFVGRSLIIGLTTPILAFGRFGLQSVVAVDKEFVRLNKILEGVAPNIEAAAKKMDLLGSGTKAQNEQLNTMVDRFNQLDKSLSATSNRFGIAKSLTVGLAADFAELGIQTAESISKITELTAKTEKLGSMDIGAAKDLVQSLYFQARRAMEQSGESKGLTAEQFETRAIAAATAQLNLFNIIENQTALSMKDIAKAFPEVASAATTFGLSMTEAAGLLAPMKAAGLEVGASANGIKFSLQSLVNPTMKTEKMFATLTEQYGDHFSMVRGSGVDAIQALINAYEALSKTGGPGNEGILQFFSQVFGKRQGTRMLLPIQQLAEFDSVLKDTNKSADSADARLQEFANNSIRGSNAQKNSQLPLIKSYKDIAIIARIATAQAGRAVEGFSASVTQSQIDEAIKARDAVAQGIKRVSNIEGIDLIGQTATEAGKAMYVELAGVKNAQEVADRELETALGSLDVTIQRVKNTFKGFATDIIKIVRPGIEKIAEVASKLYDAWQRLTPATQEFIAKLVVGIGIATAAIGPLIFALGQMRLAFGSVSKVIFAFLPGLKTMTVEMVAANTKMLNLSKPLTVMGDTVVNTSGKFATFVATMASGGGPMGKFAEKIGLVTGVLQKQTTANIALSKSVFELNSAREAAMTADLMSSGLLGRAGDGGTAATGLKGMLAAKTSGGRPDMPTMSLPRKLTAAELALPDADRIKHEADVASKAAAAYADKYRRSLEKILAGRPMPLAGGTSATGMYRYPAGSVDASGAKVGGRVLNFGAIKAKAQAEAAAYAARVESLENARGLARLKKFNADRIALLRADVTGSNKIALEKFYAMVLHRDKQVLVLAAEENAMRKHNAVMRKLELEAKGITTKLGGVGTGTLIKERFFKGKKIDDDTFDSIMGGGIKGKLTTSKLNIASGATKAYDSTKAVGSKFLGGKTTFKAIEGVAGFVKNPVTGIKDVGSSLAKVGPALMTNLKNPMGLLAKIGPMFTSLGSTIMGIIPAITGMGSGFLMFTGVGAVIAAVIAIIIILVKNWKQFQQAIAPGIAAFKEAWGLIVDGIKGAIQPILDFFGELTGGAGSSSVAIKVLATAFNIVADVVKYVAKVIQFLLKSVVGNGIRQILGPILSLIKGVISFISGIINVFKGNFAKGFGQIADGIGKVVVGLMGPFAGLFSFVLKGLSKLVGALGILPDFLGGGIAKKASAALKGAADYIDKAKKMKPVVAKVKVTPEIPVPNTNSMQEKIANDIGNGFKEGAKKGAAELARAKVTAGYSKSLKEELQNDIQDRIKNTMQEVVAKLTDGLKDQKEASLKLFDDQLSKIEETAKAEERLTKTKEYENKKREMEEKRALNQLNSQRNYQLAIYEGRIDDARQISLEGRKSEVDSQKEIGDLETSRSQELADQKKSDLMDSIKTAKDAATKYFDDAIKDFTGAAKKITEFPPTTAAKFNEQLEALKVAANDYGKTAGGKFTGSFTGPLATLGVDAKGPLTTGLEAVAKIITDNNPFGEKGVWQTTIDASILGLKNKYIGLSETLNTAVGESSDAFKELFKIYTEYKDLVAKNEAGDAGTGAGGTGSGTGKGDGKGTGDGKGGTGGGTGSGTGGGTGTDSGVVQIGKGGIVTARGMAQVMMANYRGSNGAFILNNLAAAFEMAKNNKSKENILVIFADFLKKYPTLTNAANKTSLAIIKSLYVQGADATGHNGYKLREMGGPIPYGDGGATHGPVQQGIPAVLHGGEYVVRNSAVKKYGWGMLQNINQGTYQPKPFENGGVIPEYKIGGAVKGGAGKKIVDRSKLNPFSDVNYKPKSEPVKQKKGFLDKIQGGVNSVMNTAADFVDYSGKQIKGMTYDPIKRAQEASLNPLMKLFKVPGSKNLKIATPKQAALSGFETGLGMFGGPAMQSVISKIAGIGLKGGLGPLDRLGASIANKIGNKPVDTGKLLYPDALDMVFNPSTKAFELPTGLRPKVNPALKKPTANLELFRKPIVPETVKFSSVETIGSYETTLAEKFADIYDIGGSKVAFGVDKRFKASNPLVKTFERNPYSISPNSKNPVKLANDYMHATHANIEAKGPATQVDALLYALTKGDAKAAVEFNALVAKGRMTAKQPRPVVTSVQDIAKKYPTLAEDMIKMGLDKFDPKDLYFVHETAYNPGVDKFGNLSLRTRSDFDTSVQDKMSINGQVSTRMNDFYDYASLDPIQYALTEKEVRAQVIADAKMRKNQIIGDTVYFPQQDYFRDTIHFALNHLVQGHSLRPNLDQGHIIVANLMKVLEANPGSLSNLFGVDSWITPKPGEGLKIPAGSYDILKAGPKAATDVQNNILKKVLGTNEFGELIMPTNGNSPLVPSGVENTSSPWASYFQIMGNKLGVTSQMHLESASKGLSIAKNNAYYNNMPAGWEDLAPNEIARLLKTRNIFSGVENKLKTIGGVDFAKGGLIQGFANGGAVPGFGSQGIAAMLHGGEYVVNSNAVKNIGLTALQAMNDMRFNTPKSPAYSGPVQPQEKLTSSVNIYVDNFIGEKQWFESMMKDYNINVGPQNQKTAGLQSRTISTYNGLNRGL